MHIYPVVVPTDTAESFVRQCITSLILWYRKSLQVHIDSLYQCWPIEHISENNSGQPQCSSRYRMICDTRLLLQKPFRALNKKLIGWLYKQWSDRFWNRNKNHSLWYRSEQSITIWFDGINYICIYHVFNRWRGKYIFFKTKYVCNVSASHQCLK